MKSKEVDEQDYFNEACRTIGLGKRFDIENYPKVPSYPVYEHTRTVAKELIASAKQHLPNLPSIHFDFLESSQINACAFKHDSSYFIAVTAGAVAMIHLVLDRILANADSLKWIGDPSLERDDLPAVPWTIIDPEQLFHLGVRPIVAQDPLRCQYAKHLADQALMFLVGHEIAHITRGHVDYLAASTGNHFITELGWNGTAEQTLERQAVEADADRRAVFARCYSMFMAAEINKSKNLPWTGEPATVGGLQFDWAYAVNVFFRLFGDKRFAGINLEIDSYPPLPLRRRMAMEYGFQVLLENWGEEYKDEIEFSLGGSVRVAESSFLAIGAPPPEGGLLDSYNDDATKHLQCLRECWLHLKGKLKTYSYETL